ncbi:MAG: hypothetical protein ACHQD8_07155 [Chitinophagales bacterium]
MALYSLVTYLKYRWKAKGRHGIHSPFVYDLIEQVLLNKGLINKAYIVDYPSLALQYENLISRIAAHYKYREMLHLPPGNEAIIKPHADMLLLNEAHPLQWLSLMNKYFYLIENDSAVLAVDIHKTPEHTKGWLQLCTAPNVRMSIDLYGVGVLFFKKEFKEKQHFILKY